MNPHSLTTSDTRAPLLVATLILLGSTGLAMLANPTLGEGYSALIFVAGITMIGAYAGLVIGTTCAFVGALSFNYFIAEPVFTFSFYRPHDFVPLLVFIVCSVVSGGISGRARDQSRAATRLAAQIERLLGASTAYQSATDCAQIRKLLADAVIAAGMTGSLFWRDRGAIACIAGNDPARDVADHARAVIDGHADPRVVPGLRVEPVGDRAAPVGALALARTGAAGDEAGNYLFGLVQFANLALERIRLADALAERQAEARLDALQAALLMSISHDLRTPLTAISTAATSLRLYPDAIDPETRDALLKSIDDECERMNRLTGNLLHMTRIEAGVVKRQAQAQSAADLVHATLRRFGRDGAARRITSASIDETLTIAVDSTLFEQALGNIIDNAIKYSAPDSPITLECRREGHECAIAVTDSGCGIAPEDQPHVFHRFYRAGGARGTSGVSGSGLGLAIAQGFVEASGGTITLRSPVADGRGTTVTIRLPLVNEAGTR